MKICGVLKHEQRHWYLLQSQFKYRRNGKNINIQEGREFGVVLGLLQQSNVNDYSGQLHKLTVCCQLDTGDLSSFVNFSHLFPEQHWGLEELAVETSACLMFQNWTRNSISHAATNQLTLLQFSLQLSKTVLLYCKATICNLTTTHGFENEA